MSSRTWRGNACAVTVSLIRRYNPLNRIPVQVSLMASAEGSSATDLSLIERVQRGDQAAWTRLDACYQRLIVHWGRQGGVAQADLDDFSQNVLLTIHRI